MARYTHLLDTSALLAHYFDEAGAAEVDAIWQDPANEPAICVLTIAELRSRLLVELSDREEVERVVDLYVDQLTTCLAVDRQIAEEAARLRERSRRRLPLVDACIAGSAKVHQCVLVHRDPHMDQISATDLAQLRLPDRL
jgi:predicted nucleic acid-binding protein